MGENREDVVKGARKLSIGRSFLQAATDARTFRKGQEYARSGRVGIIAEQDGVIEAVVRGTQPYRTKLWKEKRKLLFSCTCPLGKEEIFCKHGVALGLVWLGDGPQRDDTEEDPAALPGGADTSLSIREDFPADFPGEDVRQHLLSRNKSELVDILMEHAVGDDRLTRRLMVEAARSDGQAAEVAVLRAVVDDAINYGRFVDYHEAASYARGIEDAVDAIEKQLKVGTPATVIQLAEHALKGVEDQMEFIDDSDGEMLPILDRLQEIHHRACQGARLAKKQLARRLFQWELNSQWDVFYHAASTYADVLGAEGLAAYRGLVEAAWARVPSLGPGEQDKDELSRRFRLTSIMENLAQQSGDIEQLVAVWSRDLSNEHNFLRIAEEYKKAGKDELALQWAERGLRAFPRNTHARLREFLAQEYHARGRHDEAMSLVWEELKENSGLNEYQQLKSHADRFGAWPVWREKAFRHLRATLAAREQRARENRWAWRPDNSTIVEVLLWEKDVEAAWQEAQSGGCSQQLWVELARLREESHPKDAISVYQRALEPTLARKNIDAYRGAVQTLRRIQRLMMGLGMDAEFQKYLEEVRAVHRQKRNFMKLLDHVRWAS
jgi:uncharacterized Zn finger protein